MSDTFTFEHDRDAYVLRGMEAGQSYRIVVPCDFIDDETGGPADEDTRLGWLRANLPNILETYTAKVGGGHVSAPWSRVLVEEVE